MTHDSALLSALVDGELDHDARDRVLAHLAQCDECREVVEAEREVRSLIGGLAEAPDSTPADSLVQGLLAIGGSADPGSPRTNPLQRRVVAPAPRAEGQPGMGQPAGPAFGRPPTRPTRRPTASTTRPTTLPAATGRAPLDHTRPPAPSGRRARLRRRVTAGVLGAASVVGMTAVLVFAVTSDQQPAPRVDIVPPVRQLEVDPADGKADVSEPGSRLWDEMPVTEPFEWTGR